MAVHVTLTKAHFERTLSSMMKECVNDENSIVKVHYYDAPADDMYEIKMQGMGGIGAGIVDCIPRLNRRDAWQVDRSQPGAQTIGGLLLLIANAEPGITAQEFFRDEA